MLCLTLQVRRFEAAAAKKSAASEKRKASREAKKAAELQSASEDEEPQPQLPIASSVPPVKERKKREPKVEFTQVHSRGTSKPRSVQEDPRQEAYQDTEAARKRRVADQQRKRAALYGTAQAPSRPRMR